MAVKNNVLPGEVDVAALRATLAAEGVMLTPED